MLRVIVLDFDGVVLESADVKTAAFGRLFADYPDHVEAFLAYHRKNMGLSRHQKIRHFYEGILGRSLPEGELERRAGRFRELVLDQVLAAPSVPGVEEWLLASAGRYRRYVASGTPEGELEEIVRARSLGRFFDGVFGSPRTKEDILRGVLDADGIRADQAVFVGDGESDRRAARAVGTWFVARWTGEDSSLAGERFGIRDFAGFDAVLAGIENEARGPGR